MENYEQMFKEITKKLYGEGEVGIMVDYEALSSNTPSCTSNDGNQQQENDCWISSDENIPWAKSKIASYSFMQKMFRCNDCECVGFLSRIAEHWLGTHANVRVFQCSQCPYTSAWARCVRMHLARQHNITTEQSVNTEETLWKENPILEEVTTFLHRLKTKVDNEIFSAVDTKEKSTELETEMPTELSSEGTVELPSETNNVKPTVVNARSDSNNPSSKRYNCNYCSYATDRRDLFTRHENIHRNEKPFHCYVCLKQFNRADHVKKHFVRIHRDQAYDINKIKRDIKEDVSSILVHLPARSTESNVTKANIEFITFQQQPVKIDKSPKRKSEDKKYSCCYCTWTGMGNWCLKRHLNTHIKPYGCSLCEYKAARPERLATHVFKVHNKKVCDKCSFLTDDDDQLSAHNEQEHF